MPPGRGSVNVPSTARLARPYILKGLIMKRLATALALATALCIWACRRPARRRSRTSSDRGELICGANGTLAGFGLPDPQGNWTGFDVDFCRAIAAAIFNDPEQGQVRAADGQGPLHRPAIRRGRRAGRATPPGPCRATPRSGCDFTGRQYYDGQGFMVRKALKVNSALELNDASVCVQQGTTTELNLADYFRANHMGLKTVTFATGDEALKAYESGRCDAYTTDSSGLYGERLRLAEPSEHIVLPEIISKEPLSPAVRHGDDQWIDIVRWTHIAMLNAEELGINKANVDEKLKSERSGNAAPARQPRANMAKRSA